MRLGSRLLVDQFSYSGSRLSLNGAIDSTVIELTNGRNKINVVQDNVNQSQGQYVI